MASRIFGGANLSDIARAARERPEALADGDRGAPGRPVLAAAELALTGRVVPPLERENISTSIRGAAGPGRITTEPLPGTRAIAART